MKPALEHLPLEREESFVTKYFDYNYYPTPWHYHPELELVLVTESTGKRFIGDSISDFAAGNLAFIGPDLPHTYINDEKYYQPESKLRAKSIVIHFSEESLGKDFLQLPEAKILKKLFALSVNGLEITGKTNRQVSEKLHEIVLQKGLKKWICLLEILFILAKSNEMHPISKTFQLGINEKESERLCNVLDWMTQNFDKQLTLAQAAKISNMTGNAFSRFFAQRTRKTFSSYITELRLSKAAKLIIENEAGITEACFECGFNNLSNFNRQFLKHYQLSPLKYKKLFLNKVN